MVPGTANEPVAVLLHKTWIFEVVASKSFIEATIRVLSLVLVGPEVKSIAFPLSFLSFQSLACHPPSTVCKLGPLTLEYHCCDSENPDPGL
jgi:hypothetical protein